MSNRIKDILLETIEGYDEYTGKDLVKDGMIDSLSLLEIVACLEEHFSIEVAPEYIKMSYFKNEDTIIELVEMIKNIKD